jgi:LysR family transcriptional regulator, benzoate and cis,cis-muconate-responsive activator of ben and cat genes
MPSYAAQVLDLRRLRYFLAVARTGSFSRAAEELHVAQSAVSRQVGVLERELGAQLLERTTHDVRLTAAGELLLERGGALEQGADALWHEMRRFAAGELGRLTLGYSTSLGYETAPGALRALREALPEVAVAPVVLPSVELPDALRSGAVDLALVRCAGDEQGLERIVVRRERLGALLRRDHPLATQMPLELGHLHAERLMLHDRAAHPAHFDFIVGACRAAGFEPRRVPGAPPFDPTYAAVAAGEAIALTGESSRDAIPAALVWRQLRGAPRIEVSVLWRTAGAELVRQAVAAVALA